MASLSQPDADAASAGLPTLFGYFRSSAAYRVRIALNLKGVEAEHIFVHLRRGEQREGDYLALNPAGLVPTWREGEVSLTQSLAIIEYLDETRPDPPLLPRDPVGRARVRELALGIACEVAPLGNLRVLKHLRRAFSADEAACFAWARHWIELGFEALEEGLARSAGRFAYGDRPTLADCCLVPQMVNARRFEADLSRFPRIVAVDAACAELDAFRRAAPDQQPDRE